MHRPGQEPRALQCADVDLAQPGLVVVGSSSHLSPETQEFVSTLQQPTFKQLGSSLKLLMVGAHAAAAVEARDTCAGECAGPNHRGKLCV